MTEKPKAEGKASLLVLDASYTLEMIRERGMENSVTCRDLDGFFRHVWSVHPFASLLTSEAWSPRFGQPVWHDLGQRHTFIEGKVGRYSWLAFLFPVNFLIGQIGLFFSLWALIRRENIRVIRVGDPLYLGLFGLALKAVTGVPMLIRVNGDYDNVRQIWGRPMYPQLFKSVKVEKRIEQFVLRRASFVAAPNLNNLDFAIRNGARSDDTAIFSFGGLLDTRHFDDPRSRASAFEDLAKLGVGTEPLLISVGRLILPKFPDHIISALSAARAAGLNATLLLVGDGEDKAALEELALRLDVAEHVVFTGNQDQGWLARVLPACALYVSPSSGRALAEAALAGLPTVAYDTDWQADLVETNATGFLVNYCDEAALGDAVKKLLADHDMRVTYGQEMRKKALEMLNPKGSHDVERQVYSALIGKMAVRDANA